MRKGSGFMRISTGCRRRWQKGQNKTSLLRQAQCKLDHLMHWWTQAPSIYILVSTFPNGSVLKMTTVALTIKSINRSGGSDPSNQTWLHFKSCKIHNSSLRDWLHPSLSGEQWNVAALEHTGFSIVLTSPQWARCTLFCTCSWLAHRWGILRAPLTWGGNKTLNLEQTTHTNTRSHITSDGKL